MTEALQGLLLFTAGGTLVLLGLVVAARIPVRAALAVYAFVLPFGSAVRLPLGSSPFGTLSTVVGLLTTVILMLHLLAGRRGPRSVDASVGGWLLLLGWLVLTLLWTADASRSLSSLVVLTSLIALHTVASLTPFDRQDVRLLEFATVAGALVVASRSVFLGVTGRLHETSQVIPRFTFDEGDPNITAATLLLGFILTAWWSLNATSTVARVASIGAFSFITVGLALAGSRGGLVAAVAGLVTLSMHSRRLPPARIAVFLGALAAVAAIAVQTMPPGLQSHMQGRDSTGRLAIWEVGLRSCNETCMVGNGVGTFGNAYRDVYYTDLGVPGFGDRLWAAHNTFLSMLIEGGVIGAGLLIGSFLLLIWSLARLPPNWRGPPLAAVVALIASNMLVTNLNFKYFWLTITYATLSVHAHRSARSGSRDGSVAEPITVDGCLSRS